ncbi:transcription factor HHO3-like isoform X1 [Zingiber officinale]|uniref:transcription factor HHO3-like isoform X1 n=1 Tax=Zingiber officinale TaxID=94328 RepID=UPI001C4CC2DC|nr:transcription factor HHO3-like isoform X1 [Zingiber officinale]
MGSTEAEVRLDLALFTARTVAGFLKAASETESGDTRVARLEESVRSLEEERRKIEVFKRELPLCMHLLNDVIKGLEKELEQCRGERYARVFGELIPIGRKFEEEEKRVKPERGAVETMKWISYSQHRIDNSARNDRRDDEIEKVEVCRIIFSSVFLQKMVLFLFLKLIFGIVRPQGSGDLNRKKKENLFLESKRLSGGAFVPFKGPSTVTVNSKEETLDFPEKSTHASATDSGALSLSAVNDGHRVSSSTSKGVRKTPLKTDDHPTSSQSQHQAPRKVRRCWSPDLHRRFLSALKQLGGVQVATPKQIRELMKVDGLTNDEVKSHLQKYRLHAKKVSTSDLESQSIPIIAGGVPDAEERHSSSSRPSVSQSDSPQSPLQLTLSNTAGNCLEEDGKSESYSWK